MKPEVTIHPFEKIAELAGRLNKNANELDCKRELTTHS
jgi:hypothetical protein